MPPCPPGSVRCDAFLRLISREQTPTTSTLASSQMDVGRVFLGYSRSARALHLLRTTRRTRVLISWSHSTQWSSTAPTARVQRSSSQVTAVYGQPQGEECEVITNYGVPGYPNANERSTLDQSWIFWVNPPSTSSGNLRHASGASTAAESIEMGPSRLFLVSPG